MAAKKTKRLRRGKKMTKGAGWKLVATVGRKREFKGTLLGTFNFGTRRLALFNVPKRMK